MQYLINGNDSMTTEQVTDLLSGWDEDDVEGKFVVTVEDDGSSTVVTAQEFLDNPPEDDDEN